MTNPLRFEDLRAMLHQRVEQLPDCRKGRNTQYRMPDAALGAFGIFFTQSPSFLEYQRRLQEHQARNNAHTLFGVTQIPCDNHIRTLLDPIAPGHFDPVFIEVFERLEHHHLLARIIHQPKKSTREGTFGAKMSLRTTASQDHHGPKTNASDGPGTIQSGLIVAIGRNASGQPPGADIPCFALEPTGLSIELTGLARSAAHRLIRSNCV